MPVIQGADLTSVSTKREPFAEGEYKVTVKESELSNAKTLIIKSRIDEGPDSSTEYQNQEFWDYVNLVQNDGKQNRIGLTTIKRYLEAAFGEGSSEAEASPPDTDVLNGHQVGLYLTIEEYKGKDWKEGDELQRRNKVKRIFAL